MKNIFLCLLGLLLLSCVSKPETVTIVNNAKSDYQILVAADADSLTQKAASELQAYFERISGAKLLISSEKEKGKKYIKIGKESISGSPLLTKLEGLKRDGFIISATTKEIILAGMNSRGNLYAVYTLLEEHLGCMRFPYGEELVPSSATIEIPAFEKVYNPSFSFRHVLMHDKKDSKLIDWYRIENLNEWGMYVHTFQHLLSPEIYYDEHPEYFSLVNDRRIKDGQLCLSNPEVIQILKDNLRKRMVEKPGYDYWSVSQNDCINYCECKDCQAKYEKYGNYSGAYIEMANSIADEFPDKQISTLAYQFTRAAPKNIVPRENVNIMFCSIECNRSIALVDDKRSAAFVQEMKDWAALTDNIYMWDYVVQFENYLCPFPNFNTLQKNIQFFNQNNVDMIFEQGSNTAWSDMKELKLYLLSRLEWNVNANVDSLTNRFFELYYQQAAKPIRKYFDLVHERLAEKQDSVFLNIYGFPTNYYSSYLQPEHMVEYRALMDEAEQLANDNPILLKRVQRTRVAVDFAFLDLALNRDDSLLTFFIEEDGIRKLDPEMLTYLDRLVEIGEKTGAHRVNEKNLTLEKYRDYVKRNLEWKAKQNLAKDAKIEILTQHSPKYEVGAEAALTDGLMGGLHFSHNWLGFEGYDMELVIDFGEPKRIEKVSMNFLKALVSWVFLPKEIKVEVSMDGNYYKTLGIQHPDIENRNFRVESHPFVFNLSNYEVRYLKVSAKSIKTCPDWHRGYGMPSWIFIDELVVE